MSLAQADPQSLPCNTIQELWQIDLYFLSFLNSRWHSELKSFLIKDKTSLSFLVDTMAAYDLTPPHWAKSSTAMVLV